MLLVWHLFGLTNPNFSEAATSVSQIWNEKRKLEKPPFLYNFFDFFSIEGKKLQMKGLISLVSDEKIRDVEDDPPKKT
jgi:hypothetical protein